MKAALKITSALAATLLAAACQREDNGWTADRDTAVCVDKTGKRVPDAQCPRTAEAGHGVGVSLFLWYYLGRSSVVPYYGEPVRGESFTGRTGTSYGRAPAEVAMTVRCDQPRRLWIVGVWRRGRWGRRMNRRTIKPRADWQAKVEELGLIGTPPMADRIGTRASSTASRWPRSMRSRPPRRSSLGCSWRPGSMS